jgi:hypothetical protein
VGGMVAAGYTWVMEGTEEPCHVGRHLAARLPGRQFSPPVDWLISDLSQHLGLGHGIRKQTTVLFLPHVPTTVTITPFHTCTLYQGLFQG